ASSGPRRCRITIPMPRAIAAIRTRRSSRSVWPSAGCSRRRTIRAATRRDRRARRPGHARHEHVRGAAVHRRRRLPRADRGAAANQALYENRHSGTMTIRVGATASLDAARTARQLYEAWGSRFLDGKTVRARIDPVRRGAPELVALVTLDSPPANALGAEVLD